MDGSRTTKSSNGLAEGELRRKVLITLTAFVLSSSYARIISRFFVFLFIVQRHPTEKAYYIAKELLMTERTYKKDLEVIDLVGCCNTRQDFKSFLNPLY